MSIESFEAFIARMKTDAAFRARIESAEGEAARMQLASEAGFSFELRHDVVPS